MCKNLHDYVNAYTVLSLNRLMCSSKFYSFRDTPHLMSHVHVPLLLNFNFEYCKILVAHYIPKKTIYSRYILLCFSTVHSFWCRKRLKFQDILPTNSEQYYYCRLRVSALWSHSQNLNSPVHTLYTYHYHQHEY